METVADVTQSERSRELAERIRRFMMEHIYPNERRFYQEAERLGPWAVHPIVGGAVAAHKEAWFGGTFSCLRMMAA